MPTRKELDAQAKALGLDASGYATKADVEAAIADATERKATPTEVASRSPASTPATVRNGTPREPKWAR